MRQCKLHTNSVKNTYMDEHSASDKLPTSPLPLTLSDKRVAKALDKCPDEKTSTI